MEGVKIAQEQGIYKERCERKPKISEEQINEVKRRVKAGEKCSDVALAFGVSRQTV